jgi:hypothetical protein
MDMGPRTPRQRPARRRHLHRNHQASSTAHSIVCIRFYSPEFCLMDFLSDAAVQNQVPSAPVGLPASPKSPRRALPPTPVSPAAKSSFGMPEPEPYQDPSASSRPNPYSFDYSIGQGTSSDLLKRATTANATQAQSRRHRPLPSTESASYYSPTSPADHKNKALPDPYATHRPPGALAPAIPHLPTAEEKNGYHDQHYNAYEPESPNANGHSQSSQSLLPLRADGPQGGSKSVSRQASHETLNSSKYSQLNSPSLSTTSACEPHFILVTSPLHSSD